jgi:beta-fructofuranosidase
MFYTAISTRGHVLKDQRIGVVESDNLYDWRRWLGPGFGQLEVAQVRVLNGQPVLVFTCHPQEQTDQRKRTSGAFSTWSVVGESVAGPWDISKARPFIAEPALFAAPFVQQRDDRWALVGFRNLEPEGIFAFDMLDPITVELKDGSLVPCRDVPAEVGDRPSASAHPR